MYTSQAQVLLCDLQLQPGESVSCTYRELVPSTHTDTHTHVLRARTHSERIHRRVTPQCFPFAISLSLSLFPSLHFPSLHTPGPRDHCAQRLHIAGPGLAVRLAATAGGVGVVHIQGASPKHMPACVPRAGNTIRVCVFVCLFVVCAFCLCGWVGCWFLCVCGG